MRVRLTSIAVLSGWVGFVAIAANPTPTRAVTLTVHSGYDLFESQPGTSFMGVPFQGVPLVTYNFGGTIGTHAVGGTDTIVQRLSDVSASPGGSGTTDLVMRALQLVSSVPTNFGLGTGFYYITLQPTAASTGAMTISFDPAATPTNQFGTFSSTIDVFFDVHFGSLTGSIAISGELPLTSTDVPWSYLAPPGSLLINGVNNRLDGTDVFQDFWPSQFTERHPPGTHVVRGTTVTPEPGTLTLGGIAVVLATVGALRRRSRRAA
jgi:hypothetical protein